MPTPFSLLWRSFWRRWARRPPISSCGGTRATTPRKTMRSGRSSPPSSRRPASRSSWSSIQRRSIRRRSRRRLRLASRLTSPSATFLTTISDHGPPTTGSWISRTPSATLPTCSIRTCSAGPCGATQARGRKPCTGCRWAVRPTTFTSGRASWSRRGSLSRTFRRSGTLSGRSGARRCSRRCARPSAATTSGASACRWGSGWTPRTGSSSSWLLTRGSTSPATAASSSTTPRSGASSSRPSTATPPSTGRAAHRPTR